MNIEMANRFTALRKQHELSLERLAEKLGVSRQAVSKWERAAAYLVMGFPQELWHPGWVVFMTIPFYYWIADAIREHNK